MVGLVAAFSCLTIISDPKIDRSYSVSLNSQLKSVSVDSSLNGIETVSSVTSTESDGVTVIDRLKSTINGSVAAFSDITASPEAKLLFGASALRCSRL